MEIGGGVMQSELTPLPATMQAPMNVASGIVSTTGDCSNASSTGSVSDRELVQVSPEKTSKLIKTPVDRKTPRKRKRAEDGSQSKVERKITDCFKVHRFYVLIHISP